MLFTWPVSHSEYCHIQNNSGDRLQQSTVCLCCSGNIINQHINKQLLRLITEMHTQTHTHTQTYPQWMTHLCRSGTFSRSDLEPQALRDACPPHQRTSKLGHNSQFTSPLFLKEKKQNIMGHGKYTHTHIYTHTHTVPCVNCTHQHGSRPAHEPVTVVQP